MENFKQQEIEKIISSDNVNSVINQLIEIYNLEKDFKEEKEVKEKMEDIENPDERFGIQIVYSKKVQKQIDEGKKFDEIFPFRKLKKIIRELIEEKISKNNLPIIIEKRLGLSSRDSKNLAKDIEKKFSFLLEKKEGNNLKNEEVKKEVKVKVKMEIKDERPVNAEEEKEEVKKEIPPTEAKINEKDLYREEV